MRKAVPYLLVAAAALVLVIVSRFAVYLSDDFTVTSDNHKAFIYGFPFRVTDCPLSPTHTPPPEAAVRLVGNFLVYFGAGSALVLGIRRARHHSTLSA